MYTKCYSCWIIAYTVSNAVWNCIFKEYTWSEMSKCIAEVMMLLSLPNYILIFCEYIFFVKKKQHSYLHVIFTEYLQDNFDNMCVAPPHICGYALRNPRSLVMLYTYREPGDSTTNQITKHTRKVNQTELKHTMREVTASLCANSKSGGTTQSGPSCSKRR